MNNANLGPVNAMGGAVPAPMTMMNSNNSGAIPAAPGPRPQGVDNTGPNLRTMLNSYIYEYFFRHNMYECARAILNNDSPVQISDSPATRRDENGNSFAGNGLSEDSMDTDSKDNIEKRTDTLPQPIVPILLPNSSFLYEWFCLFWDIMNAQKGQPAHSQVHQYVAHMQQQSRNRQEQQQILLRQMRPEFSQIGLDHAQMMRNMGMQNGAMNMGMSMNMKPGNNLPRTAMANSQANPQMTMMPQKVGQIQRDPTDFGGNRVRPTSPCSADNAPSPSKKPRLENGAFNPQQGGMMPNGRPMAQGMPGQQTFQNQNPNVQAKSIATYAANIHQHHGNQMPNRPMPSTTGSQGHGSPMIPQGGDGTSMAFYSPDGMGGPGVRQASGGQSAGVGHHALQDYQMQLMLLEEQNKKRLVMARQELDVNGLPRGDGPSGPNGPGGLAGGLGPNGQHFPGTSPQGGRTGASPNPNEQMKRGSQQMNNPPNMGSPLPENAQSRRSPINFMQAGPDPHTNQNFMKGMDGNMVAGVSVNGGNMRPPSSHPGQPFNNQMAPHQLMARQQQPQQHQPQTAQTAAPMQWQGGPANPPMGAQAAQPQIQGTPQQRPMPPPSAPAPLNNPNSRNTTSSPQVGNAAPPTPQQGNKAISKGKAEKKTAKNKAASQKKSNPNLASSATPSVDAAPETEPPTPATPITPHNTTQTFNRAGQNTALPQSANNGQPAAPVTAPQPALVAPHPQPDPSQATFDLESTSTAGFDMEFASPLHSTDVLHFDFETYLQNTDTDDTGGFNFDDNPSFIEGTGEITE